MSKTYCSYLDFKVDYKDISSGSTPAAQAKKEIHDSSISILDGWMDRWLLACLLPQGFQVRCQSTAIPNSDVKYFPLALGASQDLFQKNNA